MRALLILALGLTACHKQPEGTPIPTVVIKGVSTDDITVVVSPACWERQTANYCESISRALQRYYKTDRASEDIMRNERKYAQEKQGR